MSLKLIIGKVATGAQIVARKRAYHAIFKLGIINLQTCIGSAVVIVHDLSARHIL